jgi:spoIIIJ-associated protein
MSESNRRFFSGDTLQQALVQAANYHNLDPALVAYQSVEKRHGFLKVQRKFVIEVDPESPRRPAPVPVQRAERTLPPPPPADMRSRPAERPAETTPPPPSERPAPPAGQPGDRPRSDAPPDRSSERQPSGRGREDERSRRPRREGQRSSPPPRRDRPAEAPGTAGAEEAIVTLRESPKRVSERYPLATGPVAEAAEKSANLLLRLAGLNLAPTIFQGEERLEVDLAGEDVDWCFVDDGELIMTIEHLLPRMIRSLSGEAPLVRVDCDNFHEIREERLRSLAQKIADEVRRGGRPRILEPMNPADRRIIHVTLADDSGVITESAGDGYFKRVTIRPA